MIRKMMSPTSFMRRSRYLARVVTLFERNQIPNSTRRATQPVDPVHTTEGGPFNRVLCD